MNMQDKEIDHLFRSKLDNYELEPPARLWGGIASRMDKKKRTLTAWLSIAASLLILLSAGLYFVVQVKDNTKKPVQMAAVKNNKPAKTIIAPVVETPAVAQPKAERLIAMNTIVKSRKQKVKTVKVVNEQRVTETLTAQPQPHLAQVFQKPADQVRFVVPDATVPFNEKVEIPEDVSFKSNTLAAHQEAANNAIAAAPAKKHRIHNLGDLINVIVSKVDKRKDKLIEFSSDKDEDESTLSGLNLGFIKIKKEDR